MMMMMMMMMMKSIDMTRNIKTNDTVLTIKGEL